MSRLAALALVACLSCAREEAPAPPRPVRARPPPVMFVAPAGFTSLRFLAAPSLAATTVVESHRPLADYLSRTLTVPVTVDVPADLRDLAPRVTAGAFDVVELTPSAYAMWVDQRAVRCVAQAIVGGARHSSSYVVVRDDSPVREVSDVRGGRFGFVDHSSTFGYLLPRRILVEHGVDPDTDVVPVFLGDHEAVLEAVRSGAVEAGATYQGPLHVLQRLKGVDPLTFRIIAKSERAPHSLFCVNPALPAVVQEAIADAILRLDTRERAGRAILDPLAINGFTPPELSAYDALAGLLDGGVDAGE